MRATFEIARIAVRELLHEKVSYILLGFALFSLCLSMALGQLTYGEQAKLTLDFMLGGTHLSMVLFGVFMGISLFHRELSQGSISMVLSKPISRASFLLGKFLGQCTVQFLITWVMGLLTILFCLRFGTEAISYRAIFQTVTLIACEAAVITAVTYVFAVYAGAVITALGAASLFLLGHGRGTVDSNLLIGGADFSIWHGFRSLVPDLEIFNIKALASYSHSLAWNEFALAIVYGAVCVAFFVTIAVVLFHHKDIAT